MNHVRISMTGLGAALALTTSVALAVPTDCSAEAMKRTCEAEKANEARILEDRLGASVRVSPLDASPKVSASTMSLLAADHGAFERTSAAVSDTSDEVISTYIAHTVELDVPLPSAPEVSPPETRCTNDGAAVGWVMAREFCYPHYGEPGVYPLPCDIVAAVACRDSFQQYVAKHCADRVRAYGSGYFRLIDSVCTPAT
ncbi:hypothetical protein [Sorangium sp. So ce542]|uniref:hypothetical protein n=1 Tax=Sorangium sp. So ce542 TaxID=3133316 RepID=UPI003F6468A4